MNTKILCWNCQGIGHPQFHNFVKECGKDFSSHMFYLLETRVSGVRSDGIIVKIRYSNSFWVEANGFSGEILLCWSGNLLMDILEVHSQV